MKKIALLGAARPKYEKRIVEKIKECGFCWSGWSYQIDNHTLMILRQHFNEHGYFHIYWHDIKKPTELEKYGHGTGCVEYKLHVRKSDEGFIYDVDSIYPPNPKCTPITDRIKPHRLYVKVIDEPIKITSRKWNTFTDCYTGNELTGRYPFKVRDAYFKCILDPEV